MKAIFTYNVKRNQRQWTVRVITFEDYDNAYKRMIIEARGSRIDCLIGKTNDYRWICFPELHKSCELAHLSDVFWNEEMISSIINKVDAQSVTEGLKQLQHVL